MTLDELIQTIEEKIKPNLKQEITGKILQDVLKEMTSTLSGSSSFQGIAIPSTAPISSTSGSYFLASVSGIYKNFDSLVVPDNTICILKLVQDSWTVSILYSFPTLRYYNEYVQYKTPDNTWKNLFYFGSAGGGGGTFVSEVPIQKQLGGVNKGDLFIDETSISSLLKKVFYPNYQKEFPKKPVFLGLTSEYPTISSILQLSPITNYNDLDFNKTVSQGYFTIALPSSLFLKRIEDDNGFNLVPGFDLIYKAVYLDTDLDIYNVYVSDRLTINDTLGLSFNTEVRAPKGAEITDALISVYDLEPQLSSISACEGTKAVLTVISAKLREVIPVINSVSVMPFKGHIACNLNGVSVKEGVKTDLLNISVAEGTKAVLDSVTLKSAPRSNLVAINVKSGTKAILNSVSIETSMSNITKFTVNEGTKSILSNVSAVEGTKAILSNMLVDVASVSLVGILVKEGTKALLANVSVQSTDQFRLITPTLSTISATVGTKSILNSVSAKSSGSDLSKVTVVPFGCKLNSIKAVAATKAILTSVSVSVHS